MQELQFTLPVAEVRELMPFEAEELFPETRSRQVELAPPSRPVRPPVRRPAPRRRTRSRSAMRDPALTVAERRLSLWVRIGIAGAVISFLLILMPI